MIPVFHPSAEKFITPAVEAALGKAMKTEAVTVMGQIGVRVPASIAVGGVPKTALDEAEVRKLADEGHTAYAIANRLGCGKHRIDAYCKKHGIDVTPPKKLGPRALGGRA